MAAFLLFIMAVGGGVVVADLVRENPAVGEVTVFQQTITGYPEGWLLGLAAGLGFAVAMLLVASTSAAGRRARRRQRRRLEPLLDEPAPDHDRLLDEFFGSDEPARHPGRPAHLADDHRRATGEQRRYAPQRVRHHSEPIYEQASRAARLHGTDLPHQVRAGQQPAPRFDPRR
jgi:hypothetical protein